jgi:hypothetical protein
MKPRAAAGGLRAPSSRSPKPPPRQSAGWGSGYAFSGPIAGDHRDSQSSPHPDELRPARAWATANKGPAPAHPNPQPRATEACDENSPGCRQDGGGACGRRPLVRGRPARWHGTGGVDEDRARGPRWSPAMGPENAGTAGGLRPRAVAGRANVERPLRACKPPLNAAGSSRGTPWPAASARRGCRRTPPSCSPRRSCRRP